MEMKKQHNNKNGSFKKNKDNFHVDEKNFSSTGDLGVFQSKDPIVVIPLPEKKLGGGHGPPVEHPTSFLETLTHLFKGNVGSGMFAMGDAFRNAGLIFAPVITLLLGIICVHSMHLLLIASHEMMRRTNSETAPDYAETVELVFATGPATFRRMAPTMRRICNFFLCVTQLGFCCVYFVFISDNLKQVADEYDINLSPKLWMVIILGPILLSALVRNLKYLAPLSLVANAFMITGICTTFYFTTQDVPSPAERDYIAPISSIPLYFGTAIFAFEGIGLVLPLRNEMKNPDKFGVPFGVLNMGMSIVTVLLIAIGFLSYLKFGDAIEGSVTLNFDEPKLLANIIKIVISSGVLLGYALQFYIPIGIMWPVVQERFGPFQHPVCGELLFRTFFVLVTFTLAELIPFLDSFISLVGAVSSTALALMFPPILEMVLVNQSQGTHKWVYTKNFFILIVGLIGFATGTYANVRAIYAKYQS